jgi:hypothetical protein
VGARAGGSEASPRQRAVVDLAPDHDARRDAGARLTQVLSDGEA